METADDILEEMNGVGAADGTRQRPMGAAPADPLLMCLPLGEACDLDEIVERSGLLPTRLLPRLFELELQGVVARVGGGRFVRVDRSC